MTSTPRLARVLLALLALALLPACVGGSISAASPAVHGAGQVFALEMSNPQSGWAVGFERVEHTTVGATTFRDVTPTGVDAGHRITSYFFLDQSHAWLLLSDKAPKPSALLITANAGQSWRRAAVAPNFHPPLRFVDAQHGWALQESDTSDHYATDVTLLRTSDGGGSWKPVFRTRELRSIQPNVQLGSCQWLESISWTSPQRGYAAVKCPVDPHAGARVVPSIRVTDDAGAHWTQHALPQLPPRSGITLFSDVDMVRVFDSGLAVAFVSECIGSDGLSCTSYGAMYSSRDAGRTWSIGQLIENPGGVVPLDARHAWTAAGLPPSALLTTSDGGARWSRSALPGDIPTNNMHGSWTLQFVTPKLGFATVNQEFAPVRFLRTTDGGRTFSPFSPRF